MASDLIPDAAVKAIQDSVVTEMIKAGDEEFFTRPIFNPPQSATATLLNLNTLAGLVEYVKNGPDNILENDDGLAIHVVSESTVHVLGGLFGRFRQREIFAAATASAVLSSVDFDFGRFYDAETFNIKLQSLFLATYDRDNVLRVVGNVKEETVRQTQDDGTTQTVTARAGIAKVEDVQVPNPVTLAPYRTFREIEQPASIFVLRAKANTAGSLPSCALFEADGGAWKLAAINSVAEYLRGSLPEVKVLA